jgi:hypothetical protein
MYVKTNLVSIVGWIRTKIGERKGGIGAGGLCNLSEQGFFLVPE